MTDSQRPDSSPAGSALDTEAEDTPEQLRIRRAKRERLLESGVEAYPVSVPRTRSIHEVVTDPAFAGLEPGEETDVEVSVAGRVLFVRNTGKLCFVRLQDGIDPDASPADPDEGAFAPQIQGMLSLANVGQERLDACGARAAVTADVERLSRQAGDAVAALEGHGVPAGVRQELMALIDAFTTRTA